MNRKSNFAKNTLILSIGTFLPKLAGFITLPILTGCLTKEEYGTYDLITILVSLYLPSITLQIKSAAFRFLLDVRDDVHKTKKIITNMIAITLPVSIVALLLLLIFLPIDSMTIKLWICGYYLADIMVNTIRQISRGIGNNLDYSISAIVSAFGKMLFAVIFVYGCGLGLLGGTMALCLSSSCSLVYLSMRLKIWQKIEFKLLDRNSVKELIAYSWPMVPNEMSLWVMQVSDRFVVTKVMGLATNAVYAASTKIPSLINLAQSALTLAWQENASITVKDKDSSKYYSEMFQMMLCLQAGVYSVVVAAVPILFRILIKGDYHEAYFQIPILCLAIFFSGLAVFLGGIYVGFKATKSIGITSIGAALINIVVNISLIYFIGLYAASISTLVSYIFLFLFRAIDVQKMVKVSIPIDQLVLLLLIMLAEMILCYQRNLLCNIINIGIAIAVMLIFNRPLVKGILNKGMKILKFKK